MLTEITTLEKYHFFPLIAILSAAFECNQIKCGSISFHKKRILAYNNVEQSTENGIGSVHGRSKNASEQWQNLRLSMPMGVDNYFFNSRFISDTI